MTRRGWVALALVLALALIWAMIAWQPSAKSAGGDPLPSSANPPPSAAAEPAPARAAETRPGAPAAVLAAPSEPPTPEQPAAAAPWVSAHPMERENLAPPPAHGPLREYRNQYGNESPQPGSAQLEARVRGLFDDKSAPSDLLDKVQCRRTICKLNVLWTPAYVKSYLVLLQALRRDYDPELAAEPAANGDADGARPIELYIKLR